MEIEQGTFTPLVFTTTGGMAEECSRYHSRLAEHLSSKKQEDYASTMSSAILRGALLCLRGSRSPRQRKTVNISENDLQSESDLAG